MTGFSAQLEKNDTLVTIRFNGEYIALRNDFKEARNTINFDQWNTVEQQRLDRAQGIPQVRSVNDIWS